MSYTYQSPDSIDRFSGIAMRITYGLFDRMEIGVLVPLDMKIGSFGARFIVLQKETFGFALITGLNVPMADGLYNRGYRTEDNTLQGGFGGVFSFQKGDNFSLDANLEYDLFFKEPVSTKIGTVYTSLDVGYYVFKHQLQLIGSVGYEHSHLNSGLNQTRIALNPGITVETGKTFILVISVPFDIYGINVHKTTGFSVALTLSIG